MKYLTIKDFIKGDTAYMLKRNRGRNSSMDITEVTVAGVGRCYVTISGPWERKFQNWEKEYLFEKVDCGEAALLFKTKEDAEEYIEKCELALWLGNISINQAEKYSVEQLRKVKEILSGQSVEDTEKTGIWKNRKAFYDFIHAECSECGFVIDNYKAVRTGQSNTDYVGIIYNFCQNVEQKWA